jgi:hypothetical protein
MLPGHSAALSKEAAIRMAISTARNVLARKLAPRTVVNCAVPLISATLATSVAELGCQRLTGHRSRDLAAAHDLAHDGYAPPDRVALS